VTDWSAVDERHHTALLLVDVINAFFADDGAFHYNDAALVRPALEQLLAAARDGGRLVVHARESHYRGLADLEGRKLPPHCVVGESDADFLVGFEPVGDEVELRKRRYSAFFGTDLALLLQEQRARRVVVAGVKTNVCIRATIQDAFAYGFEPLVPREAVNSNRPHLHEATLEDVERYFGRVVSLDETLALLRGAP
jgi:maleamate amidohydrolase